MLFLHAELLFDLKIIPRDEASPFMGAGIAQESILSVDTKTAALLADLGFSKKEAQLYTLLEKNGSFRVQLLARHLHSSVSNTYRILTSLRAKGVIIHDNAHKAYRSVPLRAFLRMKYWGFKTKREALIGRLDLIRSKHQEK